VQPALHTWTVDEFRFRSGEVLRSLRLAYATLGDPTGTPVMCLHGTGGSGSALLTGSFGEHLFGSGGPLDASRHFVILPDSLGHGRSARPSDGLRTGFPRYVYADLVDLQYLLMTQALGIDHCKVILGVSMGGMLAWEWGVRYPDFMDYLVPLSALPTAMSGRNWILRRLLMDAIRADPRWLDGHYVEQPAAVRRAALWFAAATNGGTSALQRAAPTREAADRWLDQALSRQIEVDANDYLYQMDASRDYDPAAQLHRIRAKVLAVLSEDDERCPVRPIREVMPKLQDGRIWIIPEGPETCGHATVGNARLWSDPLRALLDSSAAHRESLPDVA
jgi:homoserine O-acetyltransferase